jgi:DNA-directed RNA polymerase specialized sigma24 family protein
MEKSKDQGIPAIPVRNQQEINAVIRALLREQKYGLIKFIEYKLYKYNLHSYEADDIISDAIARAIAYLKNNEEIPNIVAWLKVTCYNIIREKSRKEKRQTALIQKLRKVDNSLYSTDTPTDTSRFSSDETKFANLLTKSLSELERAILSLMSKELSWREICVRLSEKEFLAKESATEPKTIERIKKKGNRATSKLRNLIKEAEKLNK